MLRSVSSLMKYSLSATDGEVGRVKDLYFDDESWVARYFVADTGKFLPGRQVLIAPAVIKSPIWERRILPMEISKGVMEKAPGIQEDKPVSRQYEEDLHRHYGWVPYWGEGGMAYMPPPAVRMPRVRDRKDGDPHLRSAAEVTGYHIEAEDGEIGHVDDLIIETEGWKLRHMVVDTRNWLPGKKVLVSLHWAEWISFADRKVGIDLKRGDIKDSPAYDPSAPVNREYEQRIYDYYGRPAYWT